VLSYLAEEIMGAFGGDLHSSITS